MKNAPHYEKVIKKLLYKQMKLKKMKLGFIKSNE